MCIRDRYRAAETTTTADSGAVIPTTIMNEIIQKLESYGSIYAKVRKINVQGGVSIPIADLKMCIRDRFRHEIRSIYEQLRTAGVPVREMITVQQRVISW